MLDADEDPLFFFFFFFFFKNRGDIRTMGFDDDQVRLCLFLGSEGFCYIRYLIFLASRFGCWCWSSFFFLHD